ncbi:hypothetical protein BJ912DRAFT_944896 [Pholiota molesta]|nr:hypothetical protein BJ912DRAFT_944896 [Pholiota molesta]
MDPVKAPSDNFLLPEILEQILSWLWLSPMSVDERRSLVASVCLVSKVWTSVFTRILVRHVFITSSACFQFYRRLFNNQSLVLKVENTSATSTTSFNEICLAYTCQISASSVQREDLEKKYTRDLFATIRVMPFLPNLRSLAIAYYKKPQQGVQTAHTAQGIQVPRPRFTTFTTRVVRLHLEYSFTSAAPEWLLDELGLSGKRNSRIAKRRLPSPCVGPDLEHVSVPADQDEEAMGTVRTAAPHLQLATDEEGKIRVRILAASGGLPPRCAIVHGALQPSTYVRGRVSVSSPGQPPSGGDTPTMLARGTALGFIIEEQTKQKKQRREYAAPDSNVLNTWRRVHVLMPKRR